MSLPDHLCAEDKDTEMTPALLGKRTRYLKKEVAERILTEGHCYGRGEISAASVSVGDMVVMHSETQPLGLCKLGETGQSNQGTPLK